MTARSVNQDHLEAEAFESGAQIEFAADAAFCVVNGVELTAPVTLVNAK